MKELKQKIYDHCLQTVKSKITALQQKLVDLQESLTQETKSTAGDKYETGRAMVHIEQENAGRQYADLQLRLGMLESLDITTASDTAMPGSLVATAQGFFFLSIAEGKMLIDGNMVYALSPQSPLGQKLMHCTTGDQVLQNGISYTIRGIF